LSRTRTQGTAETLVTTRSKVGLLAASTERPGARTSTAIMSSLQGPPGTGPSGLGPAGGAVVSSAGSGLGPTVGTATEASEGTTASRDGGATLALASVVAGAAPGSAPSCPATAAIVTHPPPTSTARSRPSSRTRRRQ
jgi:hypothetical protein